MPEDKRQRGKSDAKEQRKPRQGRQKGGHIERKTPNVEKKTEEPNVPQKPVFEDPGPEFYKNLKRETDEILKITEEANSKYKKKEIQSNWTKYEMPIKSYDDIEEQENLGADYEQLIQMPLSIGGHFQFKHEKSWDVSTGPSLYDKYFEIDMNDLAIALCSIPFYERNNISNDNFNESDMLTMNNRAIKYKQKYYNDKSYTTPELESQDKLLSIIKDNFSKSESEAQMVTKDIDLTQNDIQDITKTIIVETSTKKLAQESNAKELCYLKESTKEDSNAKESKAEESNAKKSKLDETIINEETRILAINEDHINAASVKLPKKENKAIDVEELDDLLLENIDDNKSPTKEHVVQKMVVTTASETTPEAFENTCSDLETAKNPVIESPEDLEKWLDDFLDG